MGMRKGMFVFLLYASIVFDIMLIAWVFKISNSSIDRHLVIEIPKKTEKSQIELATTISDHENYNWHYNKLEDEVICLADNIYFEARNQNIQGQIAVGLTTINRVKSNFFPNSLCKVVWEKRRSKKTKKLVAQFSWTKTKDPRKIRHTPTYKKIFRLAEAMISEGTLDNFVDITDNATHYHANYITPAWSEKYTLVLVEGDHSFYRPPQNRL